MLLLTASRHTARVKNPSLPRHVVQRRRRPARAGSSRQRSATLRDRMTAVNNCRCLIPSAVAHATCCRNTLIGLVDQISCRPSYLRIYVAYARVTDPP